MQKVWQRLWPILRLSAQIHRLPRALHFESLESRVVPSASNVTYHGGPLLHWHRGNP